MKSSKGATATAPGSAPLGKASKRGRKAKASDGEEVKAPDEEEAAAQAPVNDGDEAAPPAKKKQKATTSKQKKGNASKPAKESAPRPTDDPCRCVLVWEGLLKVCTNLLFCDRRRMTRSDLMPPYQRKTGTDDGGNEGSSGSVTPNPFHGIGGLPVDACDGHDRYLMTEVADVLVDLGASRSPAQVHATGVVSCNRLSEHVILCFCARKRARISAIWLVVAPTPELMH